MEAGHSYTIRPKILTSSENKLYWTPIIDDGDWGAFNELRVDKSHVITGDLFPIVIEQLK